RCFSTKIERKKQPDKPSTKSTDDELQHFRHFYSGTTCLRARYSTATVRERLNTHAEIALDAASVKTWFLANEQSCCVQIIFNTKAQAGRRIKGIFEAILQSFVPLTI